MEDKIDEENGLPPRFGYPIDVQLNIENCGAWKNLPEGGKIWRVRIKSNNAKSINLLYDKFYLPKGGKLFIFNKNKTHLIGAFTSKNNKGSHASPGPFASGLVFGDEIYLEYYQPNYILEKPIISISKVVHDYRYIKIGSLEEDHIGFGRSGDCQVNINCSPEGNDWQDEKTGVALILAYGIRWCSGSLINNTNRDATPYLLTANHCLIENAADAVSLPDLNSWIFYWHYEGPNCENNNEPNDNPYEFSTLGATVISNRDVNHTDFALLLLTESPTDLPQPVYFNGWDRAVNQLSGSVGIHHPVGDLKKIATSTEIPADDTDINYWRINWNETENGHSVAEGGSSGSPLFNSNSRIIGQLYGGSSLGCRSPSDDYARYGKLSNSWNGSIPQRRLQDWLDPNNTNVNFLLGEYICLDTNEPNNSLSQATQLYGFGHNYSWNDSLDGCIDQSSADIDYYRMNLTNQGELTITLSSQEISSLYIDWLDNGNVTSSTLVNGDKRIVICSNNSPACYDTALRIYTTVTQSGNYPIPYTLDIQWSAGQSCNGSSSGRQSTASNTNQSNSTITLNGSTNVCEGLSSTLSITGASEPFDWFVDGQSVHVGDTFNTQSLNTGQYDLFVIATSDVCSFADAQLNITSGVTANAGQDVTIQSGDSTQLQGSSGSTGCSWSPATGLSNPNSCTPTASPPQTTTYTLTVTENGCTDTDTVTITVNESNGNQPPNDDCSNATTLTSNTSCNYTSGTVEDATPSVGANNCLGCSCTSPDDYDVYYKFTAVETSHTVTVSNYASNFDAVIELRTSCSPGSSNYISCYNPSGVPSSVNETWNNLTIGQTYYIRVFKWDYQGAPPNTDTFDICVTHQNTNTDGIDLVSNITSVSNDNPDAGNQITVNYSVTNNGDETMTANTTSALYLSTNQSYDSSDILMTGSVVYALTTNLSPNQSINLSPTVTLPNVSNGQYYIISYPDLPNLITESDNNNNTDAYPIQIGDIVQNGADLDVTRVRAVPDTGLVPGQEVEIEIRIENEGNEDSSSFDVLVYLDIDGDDDYDNNEFMGKFTFNSLDAGENDTMFVDFNLPTSIPSNGMYGLYALADSNNDINETDEGNNDKDDNVTIALANGGAEDVALLNESINITTVNVGGTVDVVVNHVYLGSQTTDDLPTLNLAYYLSTDCNFNVAEDIYLDDDISNLGINNPNVDEDETLTIPPSTPSGTYYILFVADSENEVDEGSLENNNVACVPITINDSTLGIGGDDLGNKIKIYPNPVSGILTINLGEAHTKINLEIFNVIGQRVSSLEFENKQIFSVNTSTLSNGIYFFKIKIDTIRSAEFKIIKE